MSRRKLVAGNWKMNGTAADLAEVQAIAAAAAGFSAVDCALCVPATLIERAVRSAPGLAVGAQDVHAAASGAYTGCVSAAMVLDCGASLTIVGHSERRQGQQEHDAEVRAKAETALAAGLRVILCVGESDSVREAGAAVATVSAQLDASLPPSIGDAADFAVAYEPIWAIGTGKIPTMADVAEMHGALRQRLLVAYGQKGVEVRILYGGSVKGSNAGEIFAAPDVDGALVGGASLKAADFVPIIAAAAAAGDR
ncbi:MAG: triose-phosphate isomerase [Sphingomicrobium sp.]